jgi:hypothetical protein
MGRIVGFPGSDVKRQQARSVRLRRPFLVAFFAVKDRAQTAPAPLARNHPLPVHPRRIVPHVLAVPAVQVGNPMALLVLMETDDLALHGGTGLQSAI